MLVLACRGRGKSRKTSESIVCVLVGIRAERLPNMSFQCYRYANWFGIFACQSGKSQNALWPWIWNLTKGDTLTVPTNTVCAAVCATSKCRIGPVGGHAAQAWLSGGVTALFQPWRHCCIAFLILSPSDRTRTRDKGSGHQKAQRVTDKTTYKYSNPGPKQRPLSSVIVTN
jgi:hypothetical protein